MNKKKILSIALVAIMSTAILGGCEASKNINDDLSKSDESSTAAVKDAKDVKLTFSTNVVGEQATVFEQVIKDFETKTGYTVEFSAPGESYEELMKTKMASNELPDLFTTHGWSVARYSDYLTPVNDMEFYKDIKDAIKPVITDSEGKTYVLPVDIDEAGIVYNVDVLADAGVNVDDLKTWDDFSKACETIKAKGYNPIHMGGKDSWPIGQFFDWVAPSFYITNDNDNKRDELKSGKFDTTIWEKLASMMDTWTKAGYFNTDVLTADYNSDMKALAQNKTAFCFYGNSSIIDVHAVNADTKIGMMPIPSNSADDEPSLIAGEKIAVGIWKDTKYPTQAAELLNYLATPEVCTKLATASGNPTGLITSESDIGDIAAYYDKYSSIETFPYFDREYLPSGLWDIMCSTGADILAGNSDAVKNAGTTMQQNFTDKFSQD